MRIGFVQTGDGAEAVRVRGIERVRLHADLTILAKLACALARTGSVPLTT